MKAYRPPMYTWRNNHVLYRLNADIEDDDPNQTLGRRGQNHKQPWQGAKQGAHYRHQLKQTGNCAQQERVPYPQQEEAQGHEHRHDSRQR